MNDYFVMALLVGIPGFGALAAGAAAWSGRWRAWAPDRVATRFYTKRNYVPLQLVPGGIACLAVMLPLTATLEHWESTGILWTAFVLVVAPGVIITRFWWPHSFTPRWHKDWIRRGGDLGDSKTPLWGPTEKAPTRRRRSKARISRDSQ